MSFLLGLKDAGVTVGSRKLLADVTVSFNAGSRIGILGPNGAGKSTLLQMLAGTLPVDSGERIQTGGVRIATLAQYDHFGDAHTVKEAVHGTNDEWMRHKHLRDIDAGLLGDVSLDAPVNQLSGGQRRRVALARCLGADADIVLLDEPTNHLDVEGVAWLAAYMNERFAQPTSRGALGVVTHDRWFLDEVCQRIWEVVPGVDPGNDRPQIPGYVEQYDGSYAAYILARAERARQAAVAEEKRRNLVRKELAWLQRGAPARTSKPRFHVQSAEALIADVPPPRDKVELLAMATARLGKKVVNLVHVDKSYTRKDGSVHQVLRDVTWRMAPGERTGIIGVNGAGKTTLLRLISGDIQPDSGTVTHGKTVKLAFLSQNTHELDALGDKRVVEAVSMVKERIMIGDREISAAQLVERLGFTKKRAWTEVKKLSGGERRRLQLMRLLMDEPNVLLLDEPTNDLDTDTLASLEDLLDSFPGTLIIVSHDRYLLERATDQQMALSHEGTLELLPGGVDQYLERRRQLRQQVEREAESRQEPPSSGLTGAQEYQLRKKLSSIERKISQVNDDIADLEQTMAKLSADPTPDNLAALTDCDEQVRAKRQECDQLEESWLQISEQVDQG